MTAKFYTREFIRISIQNIACSQHNMHNTQHSTAHKSLVGTTSDFLNIFFIHMYEF